MDPSDLMYGGLCRKIEESRFYQELTPEEQEDVSNWLRAKEVKAYLIDVLLNNNSEKGLNSKLVIDESLLFSSNSSVFRKGDTLEHLKHRRTYINRVS